MHKTLLCFLFSILFSGLYAQKGTIRLSFNGEGSLPVFQNVPGFGVFLKGSYGTGKYSAITLSGGISKFNSTTNETGEVTTMLIPFLLGYKHNIKGFFIEPRIGIGELGGKILINGDYSRPSVAAIFGGLAAGYTIKRIELGLGILAVQGIENSSAGLWYNKDFHYASIFMGYYLW